MVEWRGELAWAWTLLLKMEVLDLDCKSWAKFLSSALRIIDNAQVAFVGGRRRGDNILFCQKLLHNYHSHSENGNNCVIKIDIMKAYD